MVASTLLAAISGLFGLCFVVDAPNAEQSSSAIKVFRHDDQVQVSVSVRQYKVVAGRLEMKDGKVFFGQEFRDSDDTAILKVMQSKEILDGKVRIITTSKIPVSLQIYPYGLMINQADLLSRPVVPKVVKMGAGEQHYDCPVKDP